MPESHRFRLQQIALWNAARIQSFIDANINDVDRPEFRVQRHAPTKQ